MELTAAHPHSDSHSLSSLHFICASALPSFSFRLSRFFFGMACPSEGGGWKIDRIYMCCTRSGSATPHLMPTTLNLLYVMHQNRNYHHETFSCCNRNEKFVEAAQCIM